MSAASSAGCASTAATGWSPGREQPSAGPHRAARDRRVPRGPRRRRARPLRRRRQGRPLPHRGRVLRRDRRRLVRARLHGRVDPMIAGPNSTRRALNDRARALLKANGELDRANRSWSRAGSSWSATRSSPAATTARLRGAGARDSSRTAAPGHHRDRPRRRARSSSSSTAKARSASRNALPRRRAPRTRLRPHHLRRPGRNPRRRPLPPDRRVQLRGGLRRLTRGRQSARIYVVDGNQPDDDNELAHTPTESQPFGIGDIAQALGRRRSAHMAADASADLDAVAETLAGPDARRAGRETAATRRPDATRARRHDPGNREGHAHDRVDPRSPSGLD